MTSDGQEVRIERRTGALWVVLDRPAAFNALTVRSIAALESALDVVEADRTIRSLVITGSGRAFCAGADLKAVLASGSGVDATTVTTRFLESVNAAFGHLERLPVPTIAAINGTTLAGGLELMLCCDFAVASDAAKLGDGHANFGQIPGGGGSLRLPRRIGAARAKVLMFTGQTIDAATALDWGLVQETCPAAGLSARVDALTAQIDQKSAVVLARMKTLVDGAADSSPAVALAAERVMSEWHMAAHDRNEGLAAFAEKRTPQYIGR